LTLVFRHRYLTELRRDAFEVCDKIFNNHFTTNLLRSPTTKQQSESRSTFDKVTAKEKMPTFLWFTAYKHINVRCIWRLFY